MARCKEHGFMFDTVAKYNEETKVMDEIIQRLAKIQQRNKALLKKYNGDAKFARVHKRVCEENEERKKHGKTPIISDSEVSLMTMLVKVKSEVDQKVYDRNDILKKDAYFEQTVGTLIYQSLILLQIQPQSEDMDFVKSRIHIISMCFFTAFRQDCVYPCLSSTLPLYKLLFLMEKG